MRCVAEPLRSTRNCLQLVAEAGCVGLMQLVLQRVALSCGTLLGRPVAVSCIAVSCVAVSCRELQCRPKEGFTNDTFSPFYIQYALNDNQGVTLKVRLYKKMQC